MLLVDILNNSVFVVLSLESFGASMMYFQNWFLQSSIWTLKQGISYPLIDLLSIPFDIMTL